MICKNCNTYNPEHSKFCIACGARIDKTCPACGTENPDDAVYCHNCGVKLDSGPDPNAKKGIPLSIDIPKVMRTVSYSIAIALAIISVVFTIFMGCKAASDFNSPLYTEIKNADLFYYFGKIYKDISSQYDYVIGNEYYSDMYRNTLYLSAIIGTVICAATLITVLTLSIKAIVNCVRSIKGTSDKGGKSAIGAFAAFVVGSLCLLALMNARVSYSEYGVSIDVSSKLNDTTIIGVVLGCILTAVYFISALLAQGRKILNKQFIISGLLGLCSIVLLIVILVLLLVPAISIIGTDIPVKMSYAQYLIVDIVRYICRFPDSYDGMPNALLTIIMALLSYIIICFIAIRIVMMIVSQMHKMTDSNGEKIRGSLSGGITIFVASVALLVCSLITYNNWLEIIGYNDSETYVSYTPLIGIVVMSALLLSLEIVRKVVKINDDGVSGNTPTKQKVPNIIAMVLAAVSILFTVFMGCKANSFYASSSSIKSANGSYNLLYYFVQAFKDTNRILSQYYEPHVLYSVVAYLRAILGTIICVATLITVITFGIIAIVRSARTCLGTGNKNGGTFALRSFIAFVIGSFCLYCLLASSQKTSLSDIQIISTVRFNSATIAGLVIGGLLTAAYAVISILFNGKKLFELGSTSNILALCSAACLVIILFILSSPTISVVQEGSKTKSNIFALASAIGMSLANNSSRYNETTMIIIAILAIVGFAAMCYMIVCSLRAITTHINNFISTTDEKSPLALTVQVCVAAVCTLAISIIAMSLYLKADNTTDASVNYISLIFIVLFSIGALGTQIASKITKKAICGASNIT